LFFFFLAASAGVMAAKANIAMAKTNIFFIISMFIKNYELQQGRQSAPVIIHNSKFIVK
jgi:hypothetical protein